MLPSRRTSAFLLPNPCVERHANDAIIAAVIAAAIGNAMPMVQKLLRRTINLFNKGDYMYGRKLEPTPLGAATTVRELVEGHFFAYNAARLREACQLLAKRILA